MINTSLGVNQYTTIDSTDITYDTNGNLTYGGQYVGSSAYTYVYDAQNRLIEVKDGATSKYTYTYDTFGRRMSKPKSAADSSALTFCYAGGRIIAEYEGATLKRKYIYGAGLDEPICMIDAASGSRYYYFYDGLGSVAALSHNNNIVEAYCYDAFGRTKINTNAGPDGNWLTPDGSTAAASQFGNRFMFTGREYDSETGLYYYRARMYSPVLGRFLQPDPIGYADSMNLYAYCGNNPMNWKDPFGLEMGWGGIIGGALGGALNGHWGEIADECNEGQKEGQRAIGKKLLSWGGYGYYTVEWLTGLAPHQRDWGHESLAASSMRNARSVKQAREYMRNKNRDPQTGEMKKGSDVQGVTNYRGENGVYDSFDGMEGFIGRYSIEIAPHPERGTQEFILRNPSNWDSATYGAIGPRINTNRGPGASSNQTINWEEPLYHH